ncbi:MAG TPA: AarF/UbiB family protein [Acidimicrobiales bacterium]|nr:AarF/UbiB family protein [Acidimicrobiales bacterium]
MSALRVASVPRYTALARLLLKHRGLTSSGAVMPDGVEPGTELPDDVATQQDAAELAAELVRMGPTFVKLGQLLSTRADLLPAVYLDALGRLRDDVPPFPADEAIRVVEAELGVRVSKAFASFDRTPVGSASLGQVHKATMRDGRLVALKIQRPGIRQKALDDMAVIEELANFLDSHSDRAARMGFGDLAEQFRRSLLDELDYSREAANLEVLRAQLDDYDRLIVPRPIGDFTTSRVLTMEFVEGRSVASIPNVARAEMECSPLGEQLISAYLDSMLVHGFFHADPHPGNVLLTDDGRLALIDLGMVARLSPQVQEHLLRLLLGVANRDGEAVADALESMGSRLADFDREALAAQVTDLVLRHAAASVGNLAAGTLLRDLAVASADSGLRPRPELSMLARALLNLDEVVRILAPDVQVDEVIETHAVRIMRRRMLQAASPSKVMSAALEATAFAEALPGRLNKVLESLAEGRMTLNLEGLDEAAVMRGAQKLANRVAMGVVIASFVVAAALFSDHRGGPMVAGYPLLTVICLGVALAVAAWLVAGIARSDLPTRHRPRRLR